MPSALVDSHVSIHTGATTWKTTVTALAQCDQPRVRFTRWIILVLQETQGKTYSQSFVGGIS